MAWAKFKCIKKACGRISMQKHDVWSAKCPGCNTNTLAPMGQIICQNSNQSGDTYGVGMALVVEPSSRLIFVTSPEDTGCLEKLELYRGLGVPKERLVALVVCSADYQQETEKKKRDDLERLALVRPLPVGNGRAQDGKRSYDPNQVCKWLVNARLFEKEGGPQKEQEQRALLKQWYETAGLPYINAKECANIVEVGASTRLVAKKIRNDKLPSVLRSIWTSINHSALHQDAAGRSKRLAHTLAATELKKKPNGVILLWVRSLNKKEREELGKLSAQDLEDLKQRKQRGHLVDELFWKLHGKKRNPHHLMTPQLFETVRFIAQKMNFSVIPIGDELFFDEYLAVSSKKEASAYQKGEESNLINFWNRHEWFGGPKRRIRQLFLLWQLFRRLSAQGIPLVQIGLRSGEMEKAAYLGVPTIYLEEGTSETGARMLPVTVGGSFPKARENELDDGITQWWQDASALSSNKNPVTLEKSLAEAREKKTKFPNNQYWQNRVTTLETELADAKQKHTQLHKDRIALQEKQLDAFLFSATDHSALHDALDGGYPFFFRLLTKNVIGLYGANEQSSLDKLKVWLDELYAQGKPKTSCPATILKGTLTELEIDLLYSTLQGIQVQFKDYKKKFLPSAYLV
ncbi:hypothetical protein [Vitiosangium sp. GDMCC 1.1324]|uniref:hypothetical protein n=1 Tax=Vitiosangium sp. (strain GDMCC 1.1324) TaxID=2138576 RepID=UPI000D3B8059|nr:hypothetical protein [Vitiosangium sp. GDMCC 1.1324]PTL79882.1 hypothetical protein DAT35_31100 [Vitiosangium sp. GDMCC 1.1324]